jgi:hypothetical protein
MLPKRNTGVQLDEGGHSLHLFIFAFLGLLMLFWQVPVFAAGIGYSEVSKEEARKAASYYVKGYADVISKWKGAVVGDGTEYYTNEVLSAYEFRVFVGNNDAGYIIISARKDWMPVLEFGNG